MKTYYFPACGFGFWYLLGKYKQLDKTDDDIYIGSSGGSLVCVCSLIDKKYNLFEIVFKCALESLYEYKQITYMVNLYIVVSIFLDKLEPFIDKDTLAVKLTRIKIQVTEINGFYIKKHQIQPKSWFHLKQLCLASCYIPFVCNWNWRLRYEMEGLYFIDGVVADLYSPNLFQTFDVSGYRGLIIPSAERVTKMYLTGLNESNKKDYCWAISPYYIGLIVICFAFYKII
jgi:hypothetical protein